MKRLISIYIVLVINILTAQNSNWIFYEDFESGLVPVSFLSDYYGNFASDPQWVIQTAQTARGNYAAQHQFSLGGDGHHATQHFGDATKTPVHQTGQGFSFQDIYVQFKLHYSSGYDWSAGNNKQMIIGTDDGVRHDNTCCNPWVAHYITLYAGGTGHNGFFAVEGNNKRAASGQWFDLSPNYNGYSNNNRFYISSDQWYTIEIHRQLNNAGVSNGLFEMWIDGLKVAEYTNITYRVPDDGEFGADFDYGTNFIMLSTYIDGPAPQEQQMSYDDIIISSQYIGTALSINKPEKVYHQGYQLKDNYPNPFNSSTKIIYRIPQKMYVKLMIYDLLGRVITTVVDEIKNPGEHQADISMDKFGSGVYTYQLETSDFQLAKKMIYIK